MEWDERRVESEGEEAPDPFTRASWQMAGR